MNGDTSVESTADTKENKKNNNKKLTISQK